MIALRMLMPILTPDAIETVLGAVIERANSTGALCHEETIGPYILSLLHLRKLTLSILRRLCVFCQFDPSFFRKMAGLMYSPPDKHWKWHA
jgi:hypothetical protein